MPAVASLVAARAALCAGVRENLGQMARQGENLMDRALHATEQYFQRSAALLILVVLTLEPLGDALTNRPAAISLYAWLLLRSVRLEVADCILTAACERDPSPIASDPIPEICGRLYIPVRLAFPVSRGVAIVGLRRTVISQGPAFVPRMSDPALADLFERYSFGLVDPHSNPPSVGVFAVHFHYGIFDDPLSESVGLPRDVRSAEMPDEWLNGVAAYRLRTLGAKFGAPTDLTLITPEVATYVRQAVHWRFLFPRHRIERRHGVGGDWFRAFGSRIHRVRPRSFPVSSPSARERRFRVVQYSCHNGQRATRSAARTGASHCDCRVGNHAGLAHAPAVVAASGIDRVGAHGVSSERCGLPPCHHAPGVDRVAVVQASAPACDAGRHGLAALPAAGASTRMLLVALAADRGPMRRQLRVAPFTDHYCPTLCDSLEAAGRNPQKCAPPRAG
jgi:hypothetical protein